MLTVTIGGGVSSRKSRRDELRRGAKKASRRMSRVRPRPPTSNPVATVACALTAAPALRPLPSVLTLTQRSILALVVSWIAVAIVALPANADTFGGGPPDEGYEADSYLHTYCYGPGFDAGLQSHANYAMDTSLALDTDMSSYRQSSCDTTTDVRWMDSNLQPAGVRGKYTCVALSSGICLRADVYLDPAEIDIGTNDFEDRRKSACHEAGHSVGLRHGDSVSDCMRNGEIPTTALKWRRFNEHHIDDHINVEY